MSAIPKPPAPWQRARRCPVCCCSGGCLISGSTDPEAAICTKTESPHRIGTAGWLHVLRDGPAWPAWRRSLARLKKGTDVK